MGNQRHRPQTQLFQLAKAIHQHAGQAGAFTFAKVIQNGFPASTSVAATPPA